MNKQEMWKWRYQVECTFLRIMTVQNTEELSGSHQDQDAAYFYDPLDKLGNKFFVNNLEKCAVWSDAVTSQGTHIGEQNTD